MANDFNWMTFKARELVIARKSPPPKEQWIDAVGGFDQNLQSSPFWRGDLFNKGCEWFGEDFATSVFDPLKTNIKTWQNNASVCRCIEATRRRESLSYSHHAEVAYLDSKKQDEYLQMAIDQNLSIRQLRNVINGIDPNGTNVPPIKRLQKIENELWELIDDVEGNVQKNVIEAHVLIADAVEVQRGEER